MELYTPLSILFSILGSFAFFLFCRQYTKALQQQNDYLHLQQNAALVYYKAVQQQAEKIKEGQKLLEICRKEVLEQKVTDEKIQRYLKDLQIKYDEIHAGIYCSGWLLDSVLFSFYIRLKSFGIVLDCLVQESSSLLEREKELVQLLELFFDCEIQTVQFWDGQSHGKRTGQKAGLRIAEVKHCLVIEYLRPRGIRKKKPDANLKSWIKRHHGTLCLDVEGDFQKLTIIF